MLNQFSRTRFIVGTLKLYALSVNLLLVIKRLKHILDFSLSYQKISKFLLTYLPFITTLRINVKEILDVIVLILFVFMVFMFIKGFNKQQIDKYNNKLDEIEKKKQHSQKKENLDE